MIRTCDPNVPSFVSHSVPIPECCPVSKNPKAGSTIRVSYRPARVVVPVEALEEKVRGYIGGFESIRGMEEMIQDIARWCSSETGVPVRAVADLIIQPPYGGNRQTMRVSARSIPPANAPPIPSTREEALAKAVYVFWQDPETVGDEKAMDLAIATYLEAIGGAK